MSSWLIFPSGVSSGVLSAWSALLVSALLLLPIAFWICWNIRVSAARIMSWLRVSACRIRRSHSGRKLIFSGSTLERN